MRQTEESKQFFFAKKNQKTFVCLSSRMWETRATWDIAQGGLKPTTIAL
jgi:hypothetical protein